VLKGSDILVNWFTIIKYTEYRIFSKSEKKFKNQVNPVFWNLKALAYSWTLSNGYHFLILCDNNILKFNVKNTSIKSMVGNLIINTIWEIT